MTETTNTIAIPLHRLVYGTENVRRTGRMASTGELTASICKSACNFDPLIGVRPLGRTG